MKNKLTAVDAIEVIRGVLDFKGIEVTDDEAIDRIYDAIMAYDKQVADTKIEASVVTKEQADNSLLNRIGLDYGLTMNQIVGFMDMCDLMNKEHLKGSGVVATPFWFHEQYITMQKQNKALIEETDNVMATLATVKAQKVGDLQKHVAELVLPERSSIITGTTRPYVPGTTGPRIGDEHLDKDHVH